MTLDGDEYLDAALVMEVPIGSEEDASHLSNLFSFVPLPVVWGTVQMRLDQSWDLTALFWDGHFSSQLPVLQ